MVTAHFDSYKGPEDLLGPFKSLVLVENVLQTDDGEIIAEMVEDKDKRIWWKPFMGNKLYHNINIHGIGNRM